MSSGPEAYLGVISAMGAHSAQMDSAARALFTTLAWGVASDAAPRARADTSMAYCCSSCRHRKGKTSPTDAVSACKNARLDSSAASGAALGDSS
eukprot:100385-Chlamydomonas_euryale.AAC.3